MISLKTFHLLPCLVPFYKSFKFNKIYKNFQMEYSSLVKVYKLIESTSKRLEKTEIISDFLKKAQKTEIKTIIYLLEGRAFPEYDGRKIGFSTRMMIKAISSSTGNQTKEIESKLNKLGDLGLVAEELLKNKSQSTLAKKELDIKKVFSNIQKLATLEGQGTVNRKVSLVIELLTHSKPDEAKYIVKTVLEKLRVGIAQGIIRDSIAKAFSLDVKEVERAADISGDYAEVAELAKSSKSLKEIQISTEKPVNSMLALLAGNINEIFKALGKPAQFEYKIDGFRLQAVKGKEIKLYTRRSENATKQFPEELQVFDILYCNGKSLMNSPLKERRNILEKIIEQKQKKITLTKKLVTSDRKKAEKFFNSSIKEGHEGLMGKNIDSGYKPGRYVNGWMKLKKILDPLDLVILKSEYGEGKRAGLLTSYTIACKGDDKLLEVGKVSTGVKEKSEGLTYKELTKMLKPLIISEKGKEVTVKPKIIIEVGYEEVQKSSKYSSVYGLRFPKVIRLRTNEKTLSTIDNLAKVKYIYNSQKGKK